MLNISQYARHRGCSRAAIQKAIKASRLIKSISKDEKGRWRIDPDIADQEWLKNTDPSQQRLQKRTQKKSAAKKPQKSVKQEGNGNAKETAAKKTQGTRPELEPGLDYSTARALREEYQARLARLNYEEKVGRLVSADKIKAEAFRLGRTVRDAILTVPDRIASQMRAAESDEEAIEMLKAELIQALEVLSGEA